MKLRHIRSLATTFAFIGTTAGIPSLAVLLLYAINEIHTRISVVPTASDPGTNPDAIATALQTMTAISHNFVSVATFGFLFACSCGLIARELMAISIPSHDSRRSLPTPCLSASLRS